MSMQIPFLRSRLDVFPANDGTMSDEHGERFHQQISTQENVYESNSKPILRGDYCWFI